MGKDILKLALNLPTIIWFLLRRFAEAWAEERVFPILQKIASWAGIPMIAIEAFLAGVLFVSSIVWLFSSIRKKRKKLSPIEMQHEIKKRKQYLPKLKDVITQRLSIVSELAQLAGEYSLIEYRNRYLNGTRKYARGKKFYPKDEGMAILYALGTSGFMIDNLYYDMLKENNSEFKKTRTRYRMLFSQIKDAKLRKLLKKLWITEHISNSDTIYTELINRNRKPVPQGLRLLRKGREIAGGLLPTRLQNVMNRIEELLEGADDE